MVCILRQPQLGDTNFIEGLLADGWLCHPTMLSSSEMVPPTNPRRKPSH